MDGLDEELSAADLVADVILHVGATLLLRHEVLVGIADPQVGDLFAVERDLELTTDLFDVHIGEDVVIWIRGKNLTGLRIERGDEIGRALHLFGRGAEAARDLGKAAFAEIIQMAIDNAILETLLFADALELNE